MPLIVKAGDLTNGHNGYPPIPAVAGNALGTVFINNIPVVCTNDFFGIHNLLTDIHYVKAGVGSPTVFINNIAVWRSGDPTLCGDTGNVIAGSVYADGN